MDKIVKFLFKFKIYKKDEFNEDVLWVGLYIRSSIFQPYNPLPLVPLNGRTKGRERDYEPPRGRRLMLAWGKKDICLKYL